MQSEKQIYELIRNAGKAILEIYNDQALFEQVETKADASPLTLADKKSHEIIDEGLKRLFPEIPVISEEGKDMPFENRKDFKKFWLVDPLDGTKEFINRNGDFTVNIALIEGHYPVAGFIYMPVQDVLYVGSEEGAFRYDKEGKTNLQVNGSTSERVAVRSRSHASPEEEEILQKYLVEKEMSRGSSLKFCAVAEGSADLYYRHGPTMEWDTAAGQAILEAAGGRMYIGNKEELRFRYNKENLLNSGFLCLGF